MDTYIHTLVHTKKDKMLNLHNFKTIKFEFSLKIWYRKLVSEFILDNRMALNDDLKVYTYVNKQKIIIIIK